MDKISCLILDCVSDDYNALWEIVSVVEKSMSSVVNHKILLTDIRISLDMLLNKGYIQIAKGIQFIGEEITIPLTALPDDFINTYLYEWKDKDFRDTYKFYITEAGLENYLKLC